MKRPLWRMKTGQLIALEDMEESHILNCINMLARTKETSISNLCNCEEVGFNFCDWHGNPVVAMPYDNWIALFKEELRSRGCIEVESWEVQEVDLRRVREPDKKLSTAYPQLLHKKKP